MIPRALLVSGALSAFAAVAIGAFAAHVLKEKLAPDMFNVLEVGVRYHMYHALAVVGVSLLVMLRPDGGFEPAGWLFFAGQVVFSGSLYFMSLTGMRWAGAITPVGGLCFLAGWGLLAWRAWKSV